MEADFRALLTGLAPLVVIVPVARIVWNYIPQATPRPAIALYRVAGTPGLTHDGPDGLTSSIVQVDIWTAETATVTKPVDQMFDIRDLVSARLHGFKGEQGDTFFGLIRLASERQDSEKAGTTLYHRASLDFDVWSRAA